MYMANAHLEGQDVPYKTEWQYLLLILPLIIAIMLVGQYSLQMSLRWASVYMTKSRVVLEIYHYLGGVEPYGGDASVNHKKFHRRLRDLTSSLANSGVREEDMTDSQTEEAFTRGPETLRNHINQSLYGVGLSAACERMRRGLASCVVREFWGWRLTCPRTLEG